ncbi:DoxX family protein [Niabella beijingensis]|uniref:DoxX family protein n=1 Tax=Niabella beijingensis TaxID=2872700 RepID=UPI001CBD0B81|nr:DoxX family membrane protein [Niabella beijingensis]MBZ4188713.1 DoxX family protein [Niabella beijingensis]
MKKKLLFTACLLTGLLFINAGLNKFLNYLPMPEKMPEASLKLFTAMVQIPWLMSLVGIAEIAGGVLFIIPRYRALGALILTPVMAGILLTHISVNPGGWFMPVLMTFVMIWSIIEQRRQYLGLIAR